MMRSMQKKPVQKPVKHGSPGTNYEPKDLVKTDPKKEQFEPIEAYPIPQRQRMAGVC